jgi:hypothetical protein
MIQPERRRRTMVKRPKRNPQHHLYCDLGGVICLARVAGGDSALRSLVEDWARRSYSRLLKYD